jgi:nucleoside diphosphate kinase
MANELAYIWITPYSLLKSRTGGIISRTLAYSGLDLVGARLYMPSDGFIDECCGLLEKEHVEPRMKDGLRTYFNDYCRPDNKLDITNRCLLLLFEGEDAVGRLRKAVGSLTDPQAQGDTVRGTYGEFVKHFEPAVFVGTNKDEIRDELRLFAKYAQSDAGVLADRVPFDEEPQTTLVILKPDNFKMGSSRPGNIIDMFSRTGLSIVGAKMLRLSLDQAEEFYGPLRSLFIDKLKKGVVARLTDVLPEQFDFPITDEQIGAMADLLKDANAKHEFYRIVKYMSGWDAYEFESGGDKSQRGKERCLALLYRGPNAIEKIREALGSTNPADAAPGTVRSVYGNDLMKNGAHASDAPENAERERRIVGLWENSAPSDIEVLIDNHLKG